MRQPLLHPMPRVHDVLLEQIRAVGLALRMPALGMAALTGVATVLVIGESATGGGPVDFASELFLIPGLLGALFPVGVWKGEERFGAGFLWTLPMDRHRHALVKVCAGWVWLMTAVVFFVLWLFVLAFFTGGDILGDQLFQVLWSDSVPPYGTLDPAALRSVRWTPEPLFLFVPFTGATGAYLLASALALGTRHPLRWVIGVFLGGLVVSAVGVEAGVESLKFAPSKLLDSLNEGRYGLDALLTARAASLKTIATLSTGETVGVWRALPDLGEWGTATLLWISAGLVSLWAAALRHRERRHATPFNSAT